MKRWTGISVATALVAAGPLGLSPAAAATAAPVRLAGSAWLDTGGVPSPVKTIKKAAGGKVKKGKVDTASLTGAGIGVALIDSGVAPVQGLDQPGKVINGPDLSFESQAPELAYLDTYGHGTHLAGIIAGSDPANGFEGIAPGAHLINVKTAAADGAVDTSQVIAAIDWVVTHRNDPELNIRVLNLSFGTDSIQPALIDPLSHAVESAWKKGIVVVSSVGNAGASASRVTMPAANPFVIAVGASDPNGTEDRTDDTVAAFSNRGNAVRHADLLAAGQSVESLRVPGSYLDTQYPDARIGDRLFRGSGTSQAAAVVSGSVALLLQQRPSLNPDQVKSLLMRTADPLAGADPVAAGAGQLDIAEASELAATGNTRQKWTPSTGLGSLELSRGGSHVVDELGNVLHGERDIFGAAWVPVRWAPQSKAGTAWHGGTWNGTVWTGTGWTGTVRTGTVRTGTVQTGTARTGTVQTGTVQTGTVQTGTVQTGTVQTGTVQTGTGQTGTVQTGTVQTGNDYTGSSWTSLTWNSEVWTGRTWAGRTWAGSTWAGRTWAGRTWAGQTWAGGTWSGHTSASDTWTGLTGE